MPYDSHSSSLDIAIEKELAEILKTQAEKMPSAALPSDVSYLEGWVTGRKALIANIETWLYEYIYGENGEEETQDGPEQIEFNRKLVQEYLRQNSLNSAADARIHHVETYRPRITTEEESRQAIRRRLSAAVSE